MRILLWMKRAIQFVFDPDVYCLALLAIRHHMRSRSHELAITKEEKKRAKAVNS